MEEAVQYCVKHQHARPLSLVKVRLDGRRRQSKRETLASDLPLQAKGEETLGVMMFHDVSWFHEVFNPKTYCFHWSL